MDEEKNVDEAITAEAKLRNDMELNLKDNQNTKVCEETIKVDIENITTFEKRNNLCTT